MADAGQEAEAGIAPAPRVARLAAAVIDLALLGGIDAGVLYLTLAIAGLSFADVRVLPLVPMGAFLLMLNGGYLIAFTAAGGQTIGKMIARHSRDRRRRRPCRRAGGHLPERGRGGVVPGPRPAVSSRPHVERRSGAARSAGRHPRHQERVTDRIAYFVATAAYVGRFPIAPGTAGSIAGLALYALFALRRRRRSGSRRHGR